MMMMGCPYLPIHIWVSYSCRSLDDLLVLTEEQGHNEVVFQPLPRPVGFTWESLYESGSPTPLKVRVVRGAVHPPCSQPSPVRFTAPVRLLAAATARRWDYGLGPMSGLVPNLP